MIGTLVNDRYRLDAELGRGGMGVVYRGHDVLLDRDVAVKVLSSADLGTEGRARLLREARAIAQLNHPNIVSLHDAGESEGVSFIVMELLRGDSLFERKLVVLDDVLAITRQVCDALEHAHAHGIIHRDLKPENVIIEPDGTAKLTDFGLARPVASRITSEGAIVGTVFYLPPEQALGREIDGRTDLYSLGVMLYELTAGRLPFTAEEPLAVISQHLYAPVVPPSTYNAEIPHALDALIVRLLDKRPEGRPASAADVRQILDNLDEVAVQLPSLQASLSPLDRLVRGRLIGREREFAEARAIWQRVMSWAGRVLLISGEPGIGKTPLVREITALVEVSGGRVLGGECYAEGSAPYAPVAQVIRDALSLPGIDLPHLVLADLITLVPDLRARYPHIPPNSPLDPQSEQRRLFESVVALCTALAGRAPLLLVVEDVHWADAGTLYLLRHLARRTRDHRLLIVLSYRETELDITCCLNEVLLDLNREQLAARIKLSRFDREQTRELLSVMFQEEVTPEFLDGIYRETEGNLFFIEEVCKALIEEGKLYRENGHWRWPKDMAGIQIPQSVRLAIQARVGKLPSQVQDLLGLAAIIGREFDFDTLRSACELTEDVLVDALEIAEQAQLIDEVKRAGKEVFVFAHALTPTTLREGVSGLRRRRLHRRVAAAVEALRPDDSVALAYHYKEAGDRACAQAYYLRAADRARQVYANEEAVRFYSEALALIPEDHPARFDALAARAQVYDIVARREEQRADVDAMLALAEELDDDARRCDALIALADFYQETEFIRAQEPAEQAVAIAKALGDPVREGQALRRLGYGAFQRHDLASSRDVLKAAAARFKEADLLVEAATCLHMLSLTLTYLGEYPAALKTAEEALAWSRTAGDRLQEATSLRRLAIVHMKTHRHAEALPFAEKALALHRELGDRFEEYNALNVLGIIMGWLGRPEEAKEYLCQSLEIAEAIGSRQGISSVVSNMVWMHFRWQGEYEAALAFLDGQLAKARLANDEYLVGMLRGEHAGLLYLLGQFAPALEIAQTLRPTIETLMDQMEQIKYLVLTGMMQAELEDYAGARQHLEMALERAERAGRALETASVLTNRAYVVLLEGGEEEDVRLGLEQAMQAVALLKGTEWMLDLAYALDTAAQLHLALGQAEEALARSGEAMQLVATWPFVPEEYVFTHSRALRAAGHEAEADAYLRRAYGRVTLVADNTHDESLRRSWFENVRINRGILAQSAARGET